MILINTVTIVGFAPTDVQAVQIAMDVFRNAGYPPVDLQTGYAALNTQPCSIDFPPSHS